MGPIAPETTNTDVKFLLGAEPENVRLARDLTDVTLIAWSLRYLLENGRLIVSELFTNAMRATRGRDAYLLIAHEGPTVCLGVWDPCLDLPAMGPSNLMDESGRGLFMVAALADSHGAYRVDSPPGKVVWARLRV